jgi:hypothetical protein
MDILKRAPIKLQIKKDTNSSLNIAPKFESDDEDDFGKIMDEPIPLLNSRIIRREPEHKLHINEVSLISKVSDELEAKKPNVEDKVKKERKKKVKEEVTMKAPVKEKQVGRKMRTRCLSPKKSPLLKKVYDDQLLEGKRHDYVTGDLDMDRITDFVDKLSPTRKLSPRNTGMKSPSRFILNE